MSRRRRSTEEGHKRKFLVVIDDTEECDRALFFGSRRAARSNGGLVLLSVVPPADFQHWMGVEKIMREEAMEEATAVMERAAEQARTYAPGIEPEMVVREGHAADEVQALIEEDEDIAILVLAAGTGKEGPGPLVSLFASRAAALLVPVTVVPGTLTNEELEALT